MSLSQRRSAWLLLGLLIKICTAPESVVQGSPLQVESVVLRPLQDAEVSAQQAGLLDRIVASEGRRVEQGQLLAALDAREARLVVIRAKIEHEQAAVKANNRVQIQYAEKALEVANAELKRSHESIEQFAKSISQSQLDVERLTVEKLTLERQQAEHELALARFDQQMAQNQLEAAQLSLEQHQIYAPFAGTVVMVRGRVGEWVEVGAPILRLVATDKMRAEGFLPAELASTVLVGRQVRLQLESQPNPVAGVLRFVSPELDAVTRQVRIWAEIPNAEGLLRSGEQGSMEILSKQADVSESKVIDQ